jgi:hypothetical protein
MVVVVVARRDATRRGRSVGRGETRRARARVRDVVTSRGWWAVEGEARDDADASTTARSRRRRRRRRRAMSDEAMRRR